jgi:hypothetical protein
LLFIATFVIGETGKFFTPIFVIGETGKSLEWLIREFFEN